MQPRHPPVDDPLGLTSVPFERLRLYQFHRDSNTGHCMNLAVYSVTQRLHLTHLVREILRAYFDSHGYFVQ